MKRDNRKDIYVLTLHIEVDILFFLKIPRRDDFLVDRAVFVQVIERPTWMNSLGR